MKRRKEFFENIMEILDEAEGSRDTTYGPFSFLWKDSYMRQAVVSSFDKTSSITGLKLYLSIDILEMHAKRNASRISYKQLQEILRGTSSKKYNLNYSALDDCIDIEKNKEAIYESIYTTELQELSKESRDYLKKSNVLFPYIFIDKLRRSAREKLREFFKLCEQTTCSECPKKSEIYFEFIESMILYELFYTRLIQNKASDLVDKTKDFAERKLEEANKIGKLIKNIETDKTELAAEKIKEFAETIQEYSNGLGEEIFHDLYEMEIYTLMAIEFSISLCAMYYLVMIFEAMQVCDWEMKGITHLSLNIKNKLSDRYDKELAMLIKFNNKRLSRCKAINKKIEKILENQYPECKKMNYDQADIIYNFMVELCKPNHQQNRAMLRGFEGILSYPIYHENIKTSE